MTGNTCASARAGLGAVALAVALAPLWTGGAAESAAPTCQGQEATISAEGGDVTGTEGPDVIVTTGTATVRALGGDDRLCVVDGRIDAGAGNDSVVSSEPEYRSVTVNLGPGDDSYSAAMGNNVIDDPESDGDSAGRDLIRLGAGHDKVVSGKLGESNADDVDLGAGNDQLTAYVSADSAARFVGGPGKSATTDSLRLIGPEEDAAPWSVQMEGQVLRGAGPVASISAFLRLEPEFGRDVRVRVTGTPEIDLFVLGSGRYDVELAGGHDVVRLGPTTSAPSGRFSAGAGNDLLEVSAQFVLSVDLRRRLVDREEGRDEYTVLGFNRVTAVAPLAFVDGSAKSERLRAAGCWVELRGEGGKDELDPRGVAKVGSVRCERHDISAAGGRGNDIIVGGHTRDRLRGGPGRDRLYGGPGNDELLGDQGRDYARGSSGVDLCRAEQLRTCER